MFSQITNPTYPVHSCSSTSPPTQISTSMTPFKTISHRPQIAASPSTPLFGRASLSHTQQMAVGSESSFVRECNDICVDVFDYLSLTDDIETSDPIQYIDDLEEHHRLPSTKQGWQELIDTYAEMKSDGVGYAMYKMVKTGNERFLTIEMFHTLISVYIENDWFEALYDYCCIYLDSPNSDILPLVNEKTYELLTGSEFLQNMEKALDEEQWLHFVNILKSMSPTTAQKKDPTSLQKKLHYNQLHKHTESSNSLASHLAAPEFRPAGRSQQAPARSPSSSQSTTFPSGSFSSRKISSVKQTDETKNHLFRTTVDAIRKEQKKQSAQAREYSPYYHPTDMDDDQLVEEIMVLQDSTNTTV